MPTVTFIDARLSANTQRFDSGLKGGQKSLDNLRRSADKASFSISNSFGKMIARAAAAAAAFFTVRAAVRAFDDSASRIDRIGKIGDTLGATSLEMQAFARNSDLAGVSIEGIERSLGFMQKALGRAFVGTESEMKLARRIFSDIGVDVDKLREKSLSGRFVEISEALNSMASDEVKLAAGAKIFGKNVTEIMPAVKAASSQMRESMEFMQRFGIDLSRLDVAKVEKMNDSWGDVWRVLRGIGDLLTVQMATPLTWIAVKTLKVFENMQLVHGATKGVVGEFGLMAGIINIANNGLQLMIASAEWLEAGFQGAAAAGMLLAGIWDKDMEQAGNILAAEADAMFSSAKKRFEDVFSGATTDRFMEDLRRINKELQNMGAKGSPLDDLTSMGEGPQFPQIAQRGSAEAASIINRINRQEDMGAKIAGAVREAVMEWSERDMAMVEVTHTLIGDSNKHLEKIAEAATDEPEDAI